MQIILDTYKKTGTLHHGYCIQGDKESIFKKLCVFFEKDMNFPVKGNSDLWVVNYDSFGIDESRTLKEVHKNKSFRGDSRKIYVIQANSFTAESQNALLKVFEEPGEGNHFFILTPNAHTLLPTLRSRLLVIHERESSKSDRPEVTEAHTFIYASPGDRLLQIKKIVDDIANEKKTKSDAVAFIEAILWELKNRKPAEQWTVKDVAVFDEIIKCADYLNARSASTKMILEHIALLF